MNGDRGCRLELFVREHIESNGSAQNGSETTGSLSVPTRNGSIRNRLKVPVQTQPKILRLLDLAQLLSHCYPWFDFQQITSSVDTHVIYGHGQQSWIGKYKTHPHQNASLIFMTPKSLNTVLKNPIISAVTNPRVWHYL